MKKNILFYALVFLTCCHAGKAQRDSITIYVQAGAIHSDIVVPFANAHHDLSSVFPAPPNYLLNDSMQWIALGWGSKDFYLNTPTWADLTLSAVAKAVSGLGISAYHILLVRQPAAGPKCLRLRLSVEQYTSLCAFLL